MPTDKGLGPRPRSCPACRSIGRPDKDCVDPWHADMDAELTEALAYRENVPAPSYRERVEAAMIPQVPGIPADDPLARQVGGDHYAGELQPIQVIQAWDLGFCAGNVVKYVYRMNRKGGATEALQDIDKAIHYLQLMRQDLVAKKLT